MIPAFDPGVGFKDDKPISPQSRSPSGNPAFATALQRAGGDAPPTRSNVPGASDPPGDPRSRAQYARAADAAERADAKASTKPTGEAAAAAEDGQPAASGELDEAAQRTDNPHLQPTATVKAGLVDEADAAAVEALALQAVDEGGESATLEDTTPIAAQIGAAAWRLGPHSKTEAQAAQAAGQVLPGSAQAELQAASGVAQARQTALAETEPPAIQIDPDAPGVEEADLLQLSAAGKGKAKAAGLSSREEVELQTAQARNEVLGRLANGSEAALGQEANLTGNALRQQLQLQGLLLRNARSQGAEGQFSNALDAAGVNGVNGTDGVSLVPGGPEFAQAFEASADDVVRPRVLERVANEARWLINNDRQEVTFRLNPEHLGSVHMKVVQKDGVFRVEMLVDNLVAKQMLESDLNNLRERLQGDNPGSEFMFNVDVRKGNEQSEFLARADPTRRADASGTEPLEEAAAVPLTGRVLGQGGVSIYA